MLRSWSPLLLALALFAVLSAITIRSIPPLEGSDEFEHYAYVRWLIDEGRFPLQGEAGWNSPVRQESGQPPLYYALASLAARVAGNAPAVVFRPNAYFRFDLDPTTPDNKNTALHYPQDMGGGWSGLMQARGVSFIAGLLLVTLTYGLVGEALPGRPGAALAGALFVAAMPQVVFHSSHVSNDILAAAFATLTLWMIARVIRRQGQPGAGTAARLLPFAVMGVALGLAALTKVNTLVLGLPVGLTFLWLWSGRGMATAEPLALRTRQVIAGGATAALAFVAVAGWWFWRTWRLSGSPLGLDTHCFQALSTCGPVRLIWPNFFQWRDTFRSFWAAFGLANIRPHDWVYWLFVALIVLALVGLVIGYRRIRPALRTGSPAARQTAALLVILSSAVAGNIVLLYFWMQQILATYGRLLFPSLGGIIVLLIAGLWALRPWLARLAWVLPAAVALVSPFWLIRPAYALPDFRENLPQESLGWRYGGFAELVSLTPGAQSAAAGETLPVELCWRALETPESNYTVFLQAVGPDDAVVADRYTHPGLGRYPTSIWQSGDYFCDSLALPIPADLAQTLVYRLSVGFLNDETDERLPGIDARGDPAPPFAHAVRLVTGEPIQVETVPDGTAAIRLAGSEFPATWHAGETVPLKLLWYVGETVAADHTVFIHLRDAAGQLAAQADGPPLKGWYPTSWWAAGETVADRHDFRVPDDLPPGDYRLVAGLYDPAGGQRLGEETDLGPVRVEP